MVCNPRTQSLSERELITLDALLQGDLASTEDIALVMLKILRGKEADPSEPLVFFLDDIQWFDAGSLERVRNGVAAGFSARRTQLRGPAAEGAGEAACTDKWRDDLFVYTGRDTRDGASITLVGVREGEEDGTISADEIEGIKSRF